MGSLRGLLPGLWLGLQPGCRLLSRLQGRPGPLSLCRSPAAGPQLLIRRGPQGRHRCGGGSGLKYPRECEDGINRQINQELTASYVYLSMAYYFERDDIALRNFAKFYLEQSLEEQEHAAKLMKFQNLRGGRIILKDIKKPKQDEWGNGLEAMEQALHLEKELCEFLESNYLTEQIVAIRRLGEHITNLKRLGAPENGMGEYLFDKHTLGESS
ncbi:hypothetical protein scyTo_0014391 [Scyliorhinus torazame]|uniref:Ferritin n=1 Tax=Scyliorhinus torazame TaxID=75743 RepID=A0A401NLR2_SCYTO|nr:hypothetical protein [Scyliorhinus torazame]